MIKTDAAAEAEGSRAQLLGANAAFYGQFADAARAWYARAQESVLFMNHAIVNPPVDRGKAAE
ncbi:MAG: hypothetical protein ABI565_10470, partial [Vicinamibacteria bacterium]